MENKLIKNEVEILLKYGDIDWEALSESEKLPEEFMEKYFEYIEFDCVFENNPETVSVQFIEKHIDEFKDYELNSLFSHKTLPTEFIEEYVDFIDDLYYLSYETLIRLPESFIINNLKSLNINAIIFHGKYSMKLFNKILKIDPGYKNEILESDSVPKEIKEELEGKKTDKFVGAMVGDPRDMDLKVEVPSNIFDSFDLEQLQMEIDQEEESVLQRLRKIANSNKREIFLVDEIELTDYSIEVLKLAIKCGMTYERELFLGDLESRTRYLDRVKSMSNTLEKEYKDGSFYTDIRELNHKLNNGYNIIMMNDKLLSSLKILEQLNHQYLWELYQINPPLADKVAMDDLAEQINVIQHNNIGFGARLTLLIQDIEEQWRD